MVRYHDEEWGTPLRDDRRLFEFLILEGAQAGLSWRTILHRREGYRRAFAGFGPEAVARFGERDVARLLADPGIVRNRRKVEGAIANARAFLALRDAATPGMVAADRRPTTDPEGLAVHGRGGPFAEFLWSFVGGRPIVNAWKDPSQVPASTPESEAMSRALSRRGFRFVGPVICYALMQATGMVNDHLACCFRHGELGGGGAANPPSPRAHRER